jgi:hypothetical protein
MVSQEPADPLACQVTWSSDPVFALPRLFRIFLSVGLGGSGTFVIEAAERYPGLSAVVFELPQVVAVTGKIIQETGLADWIACAGGDLRTTPWPTRPKRRPT